MESMGVLERGQASGRQMPSRERAASGASAGVARRHDDAVAGRDRPSFDEMSPHELGAEGERRAQRYLVGRGYEILERNWTCPYGEADLIASDGPEYVFVEVKTRLMREGGLRPLPEFAVDIAKRRRYRGIAQCYLSEVGDHAIRFDVVAVTVLMSWTHEVSSVEIHHIVNAFGGDE